MSLAADLAAYIEGLTITQGRKAGRPFDLLPWERRFLRGAFRPGIADAALTVGRGAGKTTFTAAIGAAVVDGPLVQPRAESVLVASSFEQALIAFRHILAALDAKYDGDRSRFRIQDSVNRASITDRESGAMLRCIGSDPARAHGLAPALVIADELAQWPTGNLHRMLAALETARGKLPDTRMLWLGTRPASSHHPFQAMLNGGADYVQIHAARPNDPPFRLATWRKANPGLDAMPDLLTALRKEATRARRDPDKLASFRALRLNQGVSDTIERFVLNAAVWESTEGEAPISGKYALGLDVGETASMSAAAAYWPDTGALRIIGLFPERPDLAEREIADGVPGLYTRAAERGELVQAGDETPDVAELVALALDYWGTPAKVVCDSWRVGEVKQALRTAEFPKTNLEIRRMGYREGGIDLRTFKNAALDGQITPRPYLLMRSALMEARTALDPAGNEKLIKAGGGKRRNSRDDVLAAAILAVAAGRRAFLGQQAKRAPQAVSV